MKKGSRHEKLKLKGARRLITLILIAALVFSMADASSYAVTSEDVESQSDVVSELEEQQEELEDEIADLEEETTLLSDEVSELNDEISDISSAIEELSDQIEEKQEQISDSEEKIAQIEEEIAAYDELIAEAEAAANEQYEALRSWIRYTYIYDADSLLVSLLSSGSIADFLSRIQYIQSIFEYGNELIEDYEALSEELSEVREGLEEQQSALLEEQDTLSAGLEELTALEEETSSKKSELTAAVSEAQDSLSASESELSDAESAAAALEEEIAAQKAYEEELEAKLAAQEAANISTILSQEEENTAEAVVSTDEADLELLAALIYCEAGGEIYEGQVAVGCVVMNRVRSSYFPNTVSGVIYQSGQFSPVASGRLATVLANDLTTQSCYDAAAYVLAGNLPYPDFLYFRSASVTLTGVTVTWIGNQQFF